MQKRPLTKKDWLPYLHAAFEGDSDIVSLYDRDIDVHTVADVCENIFQKLSSLEEGLCFYGVDSEGPVGYFAFQGTVLVSFGLAPRHRTPEGGSRFYRLMQSVEETFLCYLYTYNQRAVRWLEKMGMKIVFNNVTLLQCQ